jgi:phosphate-selective porin OprO and OprP
VDASRGGVTFSSGPNSLTIGARVQFRWTLDEKDGADADTTGAGVGREDGVLSQFDVPRLRVTLSGGVYQPWLRYLFQFDFSRTSGTGASKIKDAIIEIRPPGRPYRLQAGQFKAPFGLQQLTSSGRLQFVERAITDTKYTPGRDMGVMLSGTAAEETLGYQAGVFNGSGESLTQTSRGHLLVGRLFYNPLGVYALSEGAPEAVERAVLHLGLGARTGKQIRGRIPAGVVEAPDRQTAVNVEFAFKRARFHSTAEYFWMTEEVENPVIGRDIDSQGFHAQAGYMIVPRTTEIGIRYAAVDGDADARDAAVQEVRGVVGYFWRAHNVKLQADVGQLRYDAGYASLTSRARAGLPSLGPRLVSGRALADTQVRVQMQVAF